MTADRIEEALAREFHAVYQAEAKRQGDMRHADEYDDLPENVKEYDRVLARYVLERYVPAAALREAQAENERLLSMLSMAERFWTKVDRRGPDECWPWQGSTDGRYGEFWADGRKTKAHRVAWELANGRPFPEGLHACHTCDNPPCVNPEHIFPATHQENLQDAERKGRLDHRGSSLRTHCRRGHEFTPENTYVTTKGHRRCRTCWKARQAEFYARAALAPADEAKR